MPVTFAPPEPFSQPVSTAYGSTTQFNQTLPVLSSLYEQNQNRQAQVQQASNQRELQAGQASAQNRERAYESDSETAARYEMQRRAAEEQRQAQGQQFQNQLELQARNQYFEQAFAGVKVGLQEEMQQRNRERGLNEIQGMISDKTLNMEDPDTRAAVNDAIAELKTGINFTQRRVQQQHAADYAAQTRLRDEEAKRQSASIEAMDDVEAKFKEQGIGTMKWFDPNTGRPHLLIKNRNTGEWYNPLQNVATGKGGKEGPDLDQPWGQFATKDGHFDATAALKDTEARAKADPDFLDEKGKINKAGQAWVRDRMNGIEAEFSGRQAPSPEAFSNRQQGRQRSSAEPSQSDKSQSEKSNPESVIRDVQSTVIDKLKDDPYAMAAAQGHLNVIKEVTSKFPNLPAAPPEVQQRFMQAVTALRQIKAQIPR